MAPAGTGLFTSLASYALISCSKRRLGDSLSAAEITPTKINDKLIAKGNECDFMVRLWVEELQFNRQRRLLPL